MVKDGDFVVFYVKNNEIYPVVINPDTHQALQLIVPAALGNNIKVIDKPQGELINLKGEK